MNYLQTLFVAALLGQLRPFYIETEYPASTFETSLSVIDEFSLSVKESQIKNLREMRDYRRDLHGGMDGSAAKIWLFDNKRGLQNQRFWQVSERSDFDKFVQSQQSGGEIVWSRNKTLAHIRNRTLGSQSISDTWFAYGDRTVIWSLYPSTHQLDVKQISRWATELKSKNFGRILYPDALPSEYRATLLKALKRQILVASQRRNGEAETAFVLRKFIAASTVRLLEMSRDGLVSARVWTKWPKTDKPHDDFEAGFKIETKSGSDLREFFDSLVVKTGTRPTSDENAGSIEVHVRFPDAIRELLPNHIESKSWGPIYSHLKQNGRVDALAVVEVDKEPAIYGALRFKRAIPDFKMPLTAGPGALFNKSIFSSYQFACNAQDGLLGFACARNPDLQKAYATVRPLSSRSERLALPLVRLKSDLAKATTDFDRTSLTGQLLEAFELTYEEWQHGQYESATNDLWRQSLTQLAKEHGLNVGEMRRTMNTRSSPLTGQFTSLLKEPGPDSDWKVHGEVRFAKGTLTGTLRVGRDLFRHLRARALAGAARRAW